MKIKKLSLHKYRNYSILNLIFNENLNVFLGENAQGKTNIIEAIYYAAMGRSHRSNLDSELVQWQEQSGNIHLEFERLQVQNQLKFIFFKDRKKEIIYNHQLIRPKELIGNLNVVLFSPEDLYLIKGAPAERRHFLDVELSQASPAYYKELMKYNRIISQRNNLLKRIREHTAKEDLLESWDCQLAALAAKITQKRLEAIKKLNMLANLMHRKISNNRENLEITYAIANDEAGVSEDLISWYNSKLSGSHSIDIMRGSTGIGPHRDDLIFKVNQVNLRTFGSQGQQRTGVLALKLAELEFLKSETGEYPILLLDDVMSELDLSRREQLLLFIKGRVQTFITATDQNYFPQKNFGKFYYIQQGKIVE